MPLAPNAKLRRAGARRLERVVMCKYFFRRHYMGTSNGTLCCAWCGKDLSQAILVTWLNGNQPCCDLCLMRTHKKKDLQKAYWDTRTNGTGPLTGDY